MSASLPATSQTGLPLSGDVLASGTGAEVILVSTHRIACDGGGGALGHPKVYYDLERDHEAECMYCGRRFRLDPHAAGGDHH